MTGRQKLLYREFHEQDQSHKEKVKQMQERLNQAEHLKQVAEMKTNELAELVDTISNDDQNELSKKYTTAKRNLIALKSNEMLLIRRHSAMANTENHLRKENSTLQADIRVLDKTAKETLLRLLVEKTESSRKTEELLRRLDGT